MVQGETTSSLKMRQAQCPLVFDTAAQTTRLMKFGRKQNRRDLNGKTFLAFKELFCICYMASYRGVLVAVKN